jgi:L-histidine Nalpha-methyltransferase
MSSSSERGRMSKTAQEPAGVAGPPAIGIGKDEHTDLDKASLEGRTPAMETVDTLERAVRRMRAHKRSLAMGFFETQGGQLGFLKGLKNRKKGRHIEDGHQYVGALPADRWHKATQDLTYKTLSEAIKTFPERWRVLRREISQPMHYISIGTGTGEKDNAVLKHLQRLSKERRGEPTVYLPIDISGDLLKMSFDTSMADIDERFVVLVWMERDITTNGAIQTVRELRDVFPPGPALISILGNTLANLSDDRKMLDHIGELLRPDDLLLIELATIPEATDAHAERAEDEYEGSTTFRDFVMASLSLYSNTDLLRAGDITFAVEVQPGRLEITTNFTAHKKFPVSLLDGYSFEMQPGETIKLYTSRKYTNEGLTDLLGDFNELTEERTSYGDGSGFGVVTKLLQKA